MLGKFQELALKMDLERKLAFQWWHESIWHPQL